MGKVAAQMGKEGDATPFTDVATSCFHIRIIDQEIILLKARLVS